MTAMLLESINSELAVASHRSEIEEESLCNVEGLQYNKVLVPSNVNDCLADE